MYNPQSLNRYAYVLNNPIRYNDPTGHKECEEINCNSGVDAATSIERDLQKTYDIQFKGRWRQKELIYLRHALKKAADSAGGADNLNDIFADAMSKSKHPTEKITFESRVGKCNGGHACWIPESGKVIFNHKIFTSEYQSAPGTWRPAELGLSNNTDAGVEITIIHEIVHVFATARPTATGIYQARIPNTDKDNAEERMANTTAFYIVSGMYDWPGRPYHFQVIRSMNSLWKATP